jgi:hypothetical protein
MAHEDAAGVVRAAVVAEPHRVAVAVAVAASALAAVVVVAQDAAQGGRGGGRDRLQEVRAGKERRRRARYHGDDEREGKGGEKSEEGTRERGKEGG